MSVSLYRKYRPVRFEDVIGQEHVTRTLVNAIRQDRVSHAYLFAGPRGTGKTSTAKILAMALNCERGQGHAVPEPDGTCTACAAIRRGSFLDVLEIDAASNRGIDEIREIRDRVQFAPVEGRMKVYIVDEVHMLTPEAFNALLKMLEEPPPHAIFVLATTEPHKVLPTILSRCQRFDFRRPGLPEIVRVLVGVADREEIEVTENTLSVIARAAGGSFRDALGILDQLRAYSDGALTLQDALTILGVAQQDLLFELVDIVDETDTPGALLFVERLTQQGTDLNQFLKDLLGHLRDLYVLQHTTDPPPSIGLSEEHVDLLQSQANRVSTTQLVGFIDLIGGAQRAIRLGGDPRLELELALIKLTRPETEASLRSILLRLEQLERGANGHGARTEPPRPTVRQGPRPTPEGDVPSAMTDNAPSPGTAATPKSPAGAAEPTGPRGTRDDPPATAPAAPQVEPNLDNIKRAWPVILETIKRQNRVGLYAVLGEGRPEAIEADALVVKFPPGMEFQAGQLARAENAGLLSETLEEITGVRFRVLTRVGGAAGEAPPEEERDPALIDQQELIQRLKEELDAQEIDDQ